MLNVLIGALLLLLLLVLLLMNFVSNYATVVFKIRTHLLCDKWSTYSEVKELANSNELTTLLVLEKLVETGSVLVKLEDETLEKLDHNNIDRLFFKRVRSGNRKKKTFSLRVFLERHFGPRPSYA